MELPVHDAVPKTFLARRYRLTGRLGSRRGSPLDGITEIVVQPLRFQALLCSGRIFISCAPFHHVCPFFRWLPFWWGVPQLVTTRRVPADQQARAPLAEPAARMPGRAA